MAICTAKRSNGVPCKAHAIHGGAVCQTHGGAAPQVRDAARRRLLSLVDPALGVLARAVRPRQNAHHWEPSAQEISAAREILTRAGINAIADEAAKDSQGQVLWEEFIQIHRRVVAPDAAD
jgi:hypothetical protein